MSELNQYIKFFKDKGVDKVVHSKRSLLAHFQGTYNLLNQWQVDESACVAGLFHSIYGSDGLVIQPLSRENRSEVQELIGEEAELLVYLFSIIDRHSMLLASSPDDINFRSTDFQCAISQQQFHHLLHIESANIAEQANAGGLLGRIYMNDFEDLYLQLSENLNEPSKQYLTRVMAELHWPAWKVNTVDFVLKRVVAFRFFLGKILRKRRTS